MPRRPDPAEADLVLEGGGVLGTAHVGAYWAFDEAGHRFQRIAGTSAGAIVGALIAAEMAPEAMEQVMKCLPYKRFRDPDMLDRLLLAGPALSVVFENGIYEGKALHTWLTEELGKLKVETFADLRIDDPKSTLEPDQRYRLVVMAADLSRGELVRLPWDYRRCYGLNPDKQPVADAVRASMSIPFFYEPYRQKHRNGSKSVLVDGGVLSNFPIDSFDRTDGKCPRWPTFGVNLVSSDVTPDLLPIWEMFRFGPIQHLEQLIATMLAGQDRAFLEQPWVKKRTVEVRTGRVSPFDFEIDTTTRRRLFRKGKRATEAFLETWNWKRYLKEQRHCTPARAPLQRAARTGSG